MPRKPATSPPPSADRPMRFRDRIVELRRIRCGDIEEHPRNIRRHSGAQLGALSGDLAERGKTRPLIAFPADGKGPDGDFSRLRFADGHGRRNLDPDEVWPVIVTDLTQAEADRDLFCDSIGEMAEYDPVALDIAIRAVNTGCAELQQMLDDLWKKAQADAIANTEPGEPADAEPQVDRAQALREKWGVNQGDLWLLGEHRLLCGDSTNPADVARVLDGCKPLLMVTDPPYGVKHDTSYREQSDFNFAPQSAKGIQWDENADWSRAWGLFAGDVAYVWHASEFVCEVKESLESTGLVVRQQVIWKKPFGVMSRCAYHFEHEPCWYCVRKGKTASWIGPKTETTVWPATIPNHPMTEDDDCRSHHPTQKPLECMARPIRNHDAPEVYDPFLGSGTTLIAAQNLNRRCFGLEISPAYCAVILQRYADAFEGAEIRREG